MGPIELSQDITYLNVASGALHSVKGAFGGFAGVITGIRTVERIYAGQRTTKLEIRMEAPGAQIPVAVISGTLYLSDGSVTVWGRMLVSRLVAHDLDPAEPIEIGVYPAGETRGSCASLRRLGDPTPLRGADFHKEDPARCRRITEEAVKRLAERYGMWGNAR